jgi:ABC-type multidrug transport system fused ATPase/permease subunit
MEMEAQGGAAAPPPPAPRPAAPPSAQWPARGALTYRGVKLSYFKHSPLVLKGVDFSVGGGEKIGIVGRTGIGKSTLLMALFRLVEPAAGEITVDGVATGGLELTQLRRRLAIIPQEPVMFSGTVRSNLDPFGEHSDLELWTVLDKCRLGALVRGNAAGLSMPVASSGSNWSLGQQQLVCLARAMLNSSRLLVLDEATAALDLETDAFVQAMIRREFADRTVLTIAHRLDSIIDCDRILVMHNGAVTEFDAPWTLLQDPASDFARLCQQTGGSQYEVLRDAARRQAEAKAAAAAVAAAAASAAAPGAAVAQPAAHVLPAAPLHVA